MKKRSFASSPPERQRHKSGASTRRTDRAASSTRAAQAGLAAKQARELKALASLPNDQIDTSDIPELPPSAWKDAVRGRFYRPRKQAVSLRLDADVVAWLKKPGKGYQTRANRLLRQHMLSDLRKA